MSKHVEEAAQHAQRYSFGGIIPKGERLIMRDEIRTTSDSGGQKGTKPERYDLIAWDAMDEVARVYAMGAKKYDEHNWRKGYSWGLSLAAATRHISLWAQGESYDDESGLHHLAHAVFHMLAIIAWETSDRTDYTQYDNRY